MRRSAYAHRGVGDIDAVHDVEILGHSCGTGNMHCENMCRRGSGACLCGTAASRSEEASSVRLVHHHEGLVHSKRGAS